VKTLTCNGCAYDGACDRQKEKRAALRGLGISSVKFICRDRASVFSPGQPVIFTTFVSNEWDGDHETIEVSYPGYCIEQRGTKVFGFITPGVNDASGEGIPFDPKNHGFVKISMRRVKPDETRNAVDLSACSWCGAYPSLGQCFKDPHHTPAGACAKERSAIQEKEGANAQA
jgi:hypothetical protein